MSTHTRPSLRTIVPFGLALVLALSACGGGTTASSGDDVLAPVPVRVAGSGGAGDDGAAATGLAADAAFGEEARIGMIAPWVVYEFVVGDGMPALPTEANGWQYPATATPDLDRLAEIAAALGVEGEPVQQPADWGGGWVIGPDDGSAPALWLAADGQLSWWYNAPYMDTAGSTADCAVRPVEELPRAEDGEGSGASEGSSGGDDTTVIEDECVFEEPEPPTGIPTADEARARATELMAQMGVDPARFEFEVYADEWYASVSAMQRFGDTASPVGWYFGFGAEGRLDYAGGVLADPQEIGPYPLVDLDTALNRLRDGYFGGVVAYADDAALRAPDVLCEEGADCAQPPTEPETVTVTLTDVRLDLWWAWDADGTVWLLPAFTFLDGDGGRYTVPAVTDEYLIVEPVVEDPAVSEPAPTDDEPGVEVPSVDDDAAAKLIGLTEDEALDAAAEVGWEVRVVARDGERFAVTDDYRTDRVNVTIDGGVVTEAFVG